MHYIIALVERTLRPTHANFELMSRRVSGRSITRRPCDIGQDLAPVG